MDIFYIGENENIRKDFESLLSDGDTLIILEKFEQIEDNSLLIVDFSAVYDDDSWQLAWNKKYPYPKNLLINNIKVIALLNDQSQKLALELLENDFFDFIKFPFDPSRVKGSILNATRSILNEKELTSLYEIGIELSSERNLERILKKILEVAMDFTDSDGGSIYLLTKELQEGTNEKIMQFEQSQSDTLGSIYSKFQMPVNNRSLSGYVVNTGKSLSISDVYDLPDNVPYGFNSSFDKQNNYRTKSMLVVPMINHNNEIIGALQLINRKKKRSEKLYSEETVENLVIDYDHKCELIIRSLGSQATIVIETTQLTKQIHDLFESFMNASVNAVESRDPSTAGHSRRVSKLSMAIAQYMNLSDDHPFENIDFSVDDIMAIKYAGLLHDFGKIGVKERILLKAKKLFEEELSSIDSRMEVYKYSLFCQRKMSDVSYVVSEVDRIKEAIVTANEPGFIEKEIVNTLESSYKKKLVLIDKKETPLITDVEYDRLVNSRGSLSNDEYEIIKSHVEHSYNFLKIIKWPYGLENVPLIARYHHEKLDGTGYPLGLKGDQIPIESQIMCIADIFDALTSSDRPYKIRIPLERALDILQKEADAGKINKDILAILVQNEIYKVIMDDADSDIETLY